MEELDDIVKTMVELTDQVSKLSLVLNSITKQLISIQSVEFSVHNPIPKQFREFLGVVKTKQNWSSSEIETLLHETSVPVNQNRKQKYMKLEV